MAQDPKDGGGRKPSSRKPRGRAPAADGPVPAADGPAARKPGGQAPAPRGPASRPTAASKPGAGAQGEIPTRLVVVAYALALVCAVAPLAVLGAGFAGAVLFTRGRRRAGAGVIAVAVVCAAIGLTLLR